jgi:WD40 repeat protein/DNA-directed RNA polymerase specialized sigma24 family protein
MEDREDKLKNYFRRNDPLRLDDPVDTELAFQLQNSTSNTTDVQERLVHLYAGDLYKWVSELLYFRRMNDSSHEEILSVLKKVFVKAITHVEQFHGQPSVSSWLFSISYQIVKNQTFRERMNNINLGGNRQGVNPGISYQSIRIEWANLEHLPEKLRSSLILRYQFDLKVADIANILDIQVQDAHYRLIAGRKRLLVEPTESHLDAQIQMYADGLLDGNQDKSYRLMQHLETCDLCRSSISRINSLEITLSESIKKRWYVSPLSTEDIEVLARSITLAVNQPNTWWKIKLPWRQVVWILGLSMIFVGFAVLFIHLTPAEREFPQLDPTSTPPLPPIVNMPPAMASKRNINIRESSTTPQYIDPAFSSDGNWAVFASINTDPTTQAIIFPTIDVYNRETNTIQVISESTATLTLPWIWWNLAPSISGDGHWIAYVNSTNDPKATGSPCETSDQHTCLDIFLYNRDTGTTRRITQGADSGAANGDSLAPTISEDGKWVAFWSAANNLVKGFNDTCQIGETRITCLYIYLYEIKSSKRELIPIRNIPGDVMFGVDRISLSADGRYVGFTVTSADHAETLATNSPSDLSVQENSNGGIGLNTSIPTILQSSEAVVYDQFTGTYELENQAQDSTPGNGASSSPVVSADGRYVVFASASTNLVRGDINRYSDVFFRDRASGAIELISVSSDNTQGNENSGLTFWGRGFYSINLSNDGRFVVFESSATNLGLGLNSECSRLHVNVCNILYVRDRQTGSTEWITALPNQDFSFFSEISSDGRWITFMQSFYNCSSVQFFCSNVMLYDRQRGWMTNLTNFNGEIPILPWTYSDSLALPWETWESTALGFSPDGTLIALGGNDSKIRLWQISAVSHLINKDKPDSILVTDGIDYFSTLAFNPGGEWLAAGTTSGAVYIWKLSDGNLIYTLKNQSNPVRKLVFSEDGAHLVISTLNDASIWSIGDDKLIQENTVSFGITAVFAIDIPPKGNLLATARGDGSVWLQNLPGGKVTGRLGAEQVVVSSLAFSDDGSLLATRSSDGTINLWQVSATDAEIPAVTLSNTFQSYGYLGTLTFSPDNKYLASTGSVGEVTLWSVPDGKLSTISTSIPNGMVYSVAFSKDHTSLAAVFESEIVLWGIPQDYSSTFFNYSSQDTIIGSPPFAQSSGNDIVQFQEPTRTGEDWNLDIVQVAPLLEFPPLIPTHLPENINFQGARANVDGSLWLRYNTFSQQATLSHYIYLRKSSGI